MLKNGDIKVEVLNSSLGDLKMDERFEHPQNKKEVIVGKLLSLGDYLKEGDMYPSENGHWEECEPCDFGADIDEECHTTWVRPQV